MEGSVDAKNSRPIVRLPHLPPPGFLEVIPAKTSPVLIVSLNTALDRTLLVSGFAPGRVYRVSEERSQGGGKGVNVARILVSLGIRPRIVGFAGQATGSRVKRDVAALGLPATWVETEGETRTCDIVVDPAGPLSTVLNGQGPTVGEEEWQTLRDRVERLLAASPPDLVVLTGSLPPGVPDSAYGDLIRIAHHLGVPSCLDASANALALGAKAAPEMLKVNADELAEAFSPNGEGEGTDSHAGAGERQGHGSGPSDLVWLARRALSAGVREVVVTDGPRGAYLFTQTLALRAKALPGPVLSPIGCGDAFLAGLVARRLQGAPMDAQLQLAIAAATANLAHFGCGIPPGFDLEEAASRVRVEPVSVSEPTGPSPAGSVRDSAESREPDRRTS